MYTYDEERRYIAWRMSSFFVLSPFVVEYIWNFECTVYILERRTAPGIDGDVFVCECCIKYSHITSRRRHSADSCHASSKFNVSAATTKTYAGGGLIGLANGLLSLDDYVWDPRI